jgi:hypothetical protein
VSSRVTDAGKLIVLVRAAELQDEDAFSRTVIERLARPLAALDGTGEVVAHVPNSAVRSIAPRGLAPASRFAAAVETEGVRVVDVARVLARTPFIEGCLAYRVEERVIREGGASLITLVAPVHRARDTTPPAFDRHWRDVHAPLALRHHTGMCEYRQLVVVESLTDGAPDYDGIGLLGFPSRGWLEHGLAPSREARAALDEDLRRFVDVARIEVAVLVPRRVRG